jgi:GMP reductase
MLAGHDECAGEIIEKDGHRYQRFYGMSSRIAMEKYAGGVADYRASEGKAVLVDYRGPVTETVREILGGVRSACTYVGARKLKELTKRTTFVRVSGQTNNAFDE